MSFRTGRQRVRLRRPGDGLRGLIRNPEEFIGRNNEIPGSLANARAPE